MTRSGKFLRALGATVALSLAAGCVEQTPPPPMAEAAGCTNHEVHFASGSVLMDAEDVQTINATTLEAQPPDAHVILVGKTDTVGTHAANMRLSRRRADNVNKALIDNGVIPAKISWFYTGKSEPVVPTGDAEDEPRNRVVRIAVGVGCPLPK